MVIALLISWYLLGYINCYLGLKKLIKNHNARDWILIEKLAVIAISFLSWAAIIAMIVIIILDVDLDKICKW